MCEEDGHTSLPKKSWLDDFRGQSQTWELGGRPYLLPSAQGGDV